MRYTTRSITFFLILSSYLATSIKAIHITDGYEVHVVNNLPADSAALVIHCQSRDNDLKNYILPVHQDFHWNFHVNIWRTTTFFCHFQWGCFDKSFEVFDNFLTGKCVHTSTPGRICHWSVRTDGFYVAKYDPPYNGPFTKACDW
ncbi:unnamed protein product [Ilex paraguariensis]|uniref:S-protein homolog n=1 Tax=Ilex paraguariensis TaxID=185542 RepID=A0ABC8UEY0_9AQUA